MGPGVRVYVAETLILVQVLGDNGPVVVLAAASEEELTSWMQALCASVTQEVLRKKKITIPYLCEYCLVFRVPTCPAPGRRAYHVPSC